MLKHPGAGQTDKESNMEKYKTCRSCNLDKTLDNFHKSSDSSDGRKSRCKNCQKIQDKARYEKNAQKNRQRALAYYYANQSLYAQKSAECYKRNRDQIAQSRSQKRLANLWHYKKLERASYARNAEAKRAWNREYSRHNLDKARVRNSRRRARLAGARTYLVSAKEMNKLYTQACLFCGSRKEINIDHIIPLAKNGTHSIGNLMPLCDNCNSTKYNKTIMEWRLYRIRIGNPLPLDKGKNL
jgi:5-methylcytosine-specific restriction endonuclease McrA